MKKVIVSMMIAAFAAISVQAQEKPDRKHEEFRPVHKERMFDKKELASLNLTDEQKTKMKSINQDLRKQTEDLRKQDNITVKESRERMEALRKDHQAQFQSLLTPAQKTQMQKDKEIRKAKMKEFGKKRQERMKQELGLTDEQSAAITENRKVTAEKIKAIRENGSLKDEEKKEHIKELMKKQKESTKSLLTEDQLKKMKQDKKQHAQKKEVN